MVVLLEDIIETWWLMPLTMISITLIMWGWFKIMEGLNEKKQME